MPIRVRLTNGTAADCTQAGALIEDLEAPHLLADKAYDTNHIISQCENQGIIPVIPPKKNPTNQRIYDKDIYKLRHLVENAFLHLKQWRGIATRYAKNTSSFLAAAHMRCLVLWLKIS
jgi:transposase